MHIWGRKLLPVFLVIAVMFVPAWCSWNHEYMWPRWNVSQQQCGVFFAYFRVQCKCNVNSNYNNTQLCKCFNYLIILHYMVGHSFYIVLQTNIFNMCCVWLELRSCCCFSRCVWVKSWFAFLLRSCSRQPMCKSIITELNSKCVTQCKISERLKRLSLAWAFIFCIIHQISI